MELYIHIPFCVRKCRYCSFVSFPAEDAQKEEYVLALLREAEIRQQELTEPVTTVFIGGGTPSLLPPGLLSRLITGLKELIPLSSVTEFTIEANPGTLSAPFLEKASELGVNRLSVGMQAAQDRLLKFLGRIHSFPEVSQSVGAARKAGFSNISLDLIFGIPGQTGEDWQETLDAAVSLGPTHISAYGLIPEEGTPLFQQLQKKEITLPDPDLERDMYEQAIQTLARSGYRQYEISNFAKEGFECRHNTGYWTQVPYLGLGVSAASMRITEQGKNGMKCIRKTNPTAMEQYMNMVYGGDCAGSRTDLVGPAEARFETMMLALRMNRGVQEEQFLKMHGITAEACYGHQLKEMLRNGLMQYGNGAWSLTRKGMDIQNSILVEFMEEPSKKP